jgi:hypothetical protein
MTDLPATRFLLELKLDAKPPRAVMSDITTGAPTDSADVELGTSAPYQLGMTFRADTPTGTLVPQLNTLIAIPAAPPRPFDPALAGDDGVLSLDWQVRDRSLETQDETVLQIALTNRSSYYETRDLEMGLELIACDGSLPRDRERPDGSALVSILPAVQWARCIGPHSTSLFDFVLVTRGPRAGLYNLAVEVNYKLVYVYRELCRQTLAIASLPLRIHGGSTPPLIGPLVSPPYKSQPEQITVPQRKLHMSELVEKAVEHNPSKRRELHAIERKVALPGGGELCVSYRLVKGSNTRPDDSRCSFGYNPRTKEIESYFSTSDEAAMEITLRNHSDFHLKHIYLTDMHLFTANDEGGAGVPADKDTLPDGNHLFEVLPGEVYFGHLTRDESRTRYLGLVTRGVHPGHFLIRFDVKYEIVDGSACVSLPLSVNPD